MSIYGYTNDQGEPIMSGEAYRFEQRLDAEYDGYYDESYNLYGDDGEAPCESDQDLCTGGDLDYLNDTEGECSWCGKVWAYDWNA